MIKLEDIDFHHKPGSAFDWCETNFFPVTIPEAGIGGGFYLLTRPAIGVCMSDVSFEDRIASSWEEQLYIDNQQHLVCPASLRSYQLSNGLSVEATDPLKSYNIRYQGIDDTEFDLRFDALMDPFDLNDPEQDPLAAARVGKSWGEAFNGHYETTGRVHGTARIRGVSYKVDCIDTLDRSWGVRKERDNSNVIWLHGSFGEELTLHILAGLDPTSKTGMGKLISGYVLENGNVYGLTDLEGHTTYRGILPISMSFKATDIRGRSFAIDAEALNAAPWAPYPSMVFARSLMKWTTDGKVGFGSRQDVFSRASLTRNRATAFS
jgi:hypothetical protein